MKDSEVFLDTVVGLETVSVPRADGRGEDLLVAAILEVTELWVGERSWRKEVYTSALSTACGVDFRLGDEFIVEAEVVGVGEYKDSELPSAASWTDSSQTVRFDPEKYEEVSAWYKKYTSSWKPSAKRVAPVS